MLKTTYDYNKAPADVLDAMKDRCYEDGHKWENGASIFLDIYQFCKWCGEKR